MSFSPDKVEEFKTIFRDSHTAIRGFEGCLHVELLQDRQRPHVFFTFSLWQREEDLEAYRNSELFGRVWSATKRLFNDKPEAWSLSELTFN
jgi:quinol monooxygenase YgiN